MFSVVIYIGFQKNHLEAIFKEDDNVQVSVDLL